MSAPGKKKARRGMSRQSFHQRRMEEVYRTCGPVHNYLLI